MTKARIQSQPQPIDGFVPAGTDIIECGTSRGVSHLILAGIFNCLIVVLSHLLYAVHSVAGLFILSAFHQAVENLFLALVYILMVRKVRGRPLAVNGAVWGGMGLAMGFWPLLPVAVPAGLAADWFIRRGSRRPARVLMGYGFYAACLAGGNAWPILLLKNSATVQTTAEMDPFFAGLVATATVPLFIAQVSASLATALVGGAIALQLIQKHFKPAGVV